MATNVETIGGTTPDRATITIWEAATDNDLVTATTIEQGQMRDADFAEAKITIAGATVSALYYRHLTVESSSGFDGTAGSGARVITSGTDHTFEMGEAHAILEGFEILEGASQGGSDEGVRINVAGKTYYRRLLIHDFNTSDQDGIYATLNGVDAEVENCIIYDCERGGIHAQKLANVTITFTCRNNTVYNCGAAGTPLTVSDEGCFNGWTNQSAGTINFIMSNNLAWGSGTAAYHRGGASSANRDSVDFTGDYNISDDDSGDEYGTGNGVFEVGEGANNGINKTVVAGNPAAGEVGVTSTTGGSEDLHLFDDADNIAVDFGVYLAAMSADVDIDGDARPGSGSWDVGADEIPVAAAATPDYLKEYHNTLLRM